MNEWPTALDELAKLFPPGYKVSLVQGRRRDGSPWASEGTVEGYQVYDETFSHVLVRLEDGYLRPTYPWRLTVVQPLCSYCQSPREDENDYICNSCRKEHFG